MLGVARLNTISKIISAPAAIRPLTITASGNAKISGNQSKFSNTSALFDGTGDYLTVSDGTGSLSTGTNNFTIEFWVRFSNTTSCILYDTRPASTQGNHPVIYWNASTIRYYQNGGDRITSSSLSINTWYHVALVRTTNDYKLYVNGTQAGSTYTNSASISASRVIIGADSFSLGSSSLNGYIDEFRISSTARYTTTFTPSTTGFGNDANTLLLMHCDGNDLSTTFTDDSGPRTSYGHTTTYAAGTLSTTTGKFGTALFAGGTVFNEGFPITTYQNNATVRMGTSTVMTYECWVKFNGSFSGSGRIGWIIGNNNAAYPVNNIQDSSGIFCFYTDGTSIRVLPFRQFSPTTIGTVDTTTWHHLVWQSNGNGTMSVWWDGTSVYNATPTTWANRDTFHFCKKEDITGSPNGRNCYFDEICITYGTAKYTPGSSFTPPSTVFTNSANTIGLFHCETTTQVDDRIG
jgi:hypothetical protein